MIALTPGRSYHIFNHANGFENVFCNQENFRYFLEKYWLFISPVAETYAYCLLPNHFHVVVRIRKREVIEALILNKIPSKKNFGKIKCQKDNLTNHIIFSKVNSQSTIGNTSGINFGKVKALMFNVHSNPINFSKVKEISDHDIEKYISKQFANLFSCYTQSFNKVYHRMGSLFIKNFKREQILNKQHFFNAVIYTHRNPIHHGFCKNFNEWEVSSYNEIVEGNDDHLEIIKLMKMYQGIKRFLDAHHFALINFENTCEFDIP